jgi:hypothetical protein
MVDILGIVPFIPAGENFNKSRELFIELGFEETWSNNGYIGFSAGKVKFILQDLHNPEFASNLMIKIEVKDIDDWWQEIEQKRLPIKFVGFQIKPPIDYPWGREIHFIDLAGVCWHVGLE